MTIFGWKITIERTKKTPKKLLLPHEKWPEILEWEVGDRFEDFWGYNFSYCFLRSLTADGNAFVGAGERVVEIPIQTLKGHNKTLATRRVEAQIQQSKQYMNLLKEFKTSLKELQQRDRRLEDELA